MNNVASDSRTPAAVACVVVACLTLLAVVAVPVAQAQQSTASEREVEARVRAELEARLAQINNRIAEQMRQLEDLRGADLEDLQARLHALSLDAERIRELAALRGEEQAAVQSRSVEEAMRRAAEISRRAAETAGRAMQRAGGAYQYRVVTQVGGCNLFAERVLDVAEDLDLSDDQVERIRTAQRASRRAGIGRNADTEVAEMDLEALYEADELDLSAIRAKLEELAALQVDSQMAGLNLRQQVRGVLTPEQRTQFEQMGDDDEVRVVMSRVSGWSGIRRIGC